MKQNIFDLVVSKNLCIGCGVCAGVCPNNNLKMEFNEYGEFNPIAYGDCLSKCSLCLTVCPFYNNPDENVLGKELFADILGIQYNLDIGFYQSAYVGYCSEPNQRLNSASGGIATWILKTLLAEKYVDYVVCVSANNNSDKRFCFSIFDDISMIQKAAKSVYYPVELSEVIQLIVKSNKRYAITGLPCFIKGLKLASAKMNKLRENIKFTLGLVCGQMKSRAYTDYLLFLSGTKGNIVKLGYRGKCLQSSADNFYFSCSNDQGEESRLFWNDGVSEAWNYRWFTPNACNFCDDIYAELADVSVMDAWLPKYRNDPKGTSLFIARSHEINNLIKHSLNTNEIIGSSISVEEIIKSQGAATRTKKNQLPFRLHLAARNGLAVPAKRVKKKFIINLVEIADVLLKNKMQKMTREYGRINSQQANFIELKTKLKKLVKIMAMISTTNRIVHLPQSMLNKIVVYIKGNN